jgi:uncharacterized membrane protein HdeD (DUF308 family)
MDNHSNNLYSKITLIIFLVIGILLCCFGIILFFRDGFQFINMMPRINGYYLSTTGLVSIIYAIQQFVSKNK